VVKTVLFALAVVMSFSLQAESRPTYRFGYSSSQSGEMLIRRMTPMMNLLSEALDADIEFIQKQTFSEMQKAFINHEIDFGILNSYSYLRVLPYESIKPIASRIIEDSSEYQSYFFARKDSGIKSIEDLKGKVVALGDPYSTSSYLIPHLIFEQHGINPKTDFRETIIINKQDSLILSVLNRTADVGVSASFIFNEQPESVRESLSVFLVSESFPLGPFIVNSNINTGTIDKLKNTLLSLDETEEGRYALESAGFEGFTEVDADAYLPLLEIKDSLNLN
jgi:phosphonate transport system substrate-binding protein